MHAANKLPGLFPTVAVTPEDFDTCGDEQILSTATARLARLDARAVLESFVVVRRWPEGCAYDNASSCTSNKL